MTIPDPIKHPHFVSSNVIGNETDSIKSKKVEQVQNRLDEDFNGLTKPGCNVAIIEHDTNGSKPFLFSCGYSNVVTGQRMSSSTPQPLGSLSKHMTSLVIYELMKKGFINLNDSIYKYLPDFPKRTFDGKVVEITIDNLLQMRSGLPNPFPLVPNVLGLNDSTMSQADKMKFIEKETELNFFPDKKEFYTNNNHFILATIANLICQREFSESFTEFANKTLFARTSASFSDPLKSMDQQSYFKDLPAGYWGLDQGHLQQDENGHIKEKPAMNTQVGPCGVIASLNDMVEWDKKIQNFKNVGFFEKSVDADFNYARGFYKTLTKNGFEVMEHGGNIDGFSTEYCQFEKDGKTLSVVILANVGGQGFKGLAHELASLWLDQDIELPPLPFDDGPPDLPPADLLKNVKRFEGEYYCEWSQKTFVLRESKDKNVLEFFLKDDDTYPKFLFINMRGGFLDIFDGPPLKIEFNEDGTRFDLTFAEEFTNQAYKFKKTF